jgi:hypothetical protein
MKKRMVGKLHLDRETLSTLTGEALDRVAGGKAEGEITPHCSLPPTWHNCTSRVGCSV